MKESYRSDGPVRVKRQQLSDEVAAYVRELVISGGVRPGEYLRLEPIAEAVGVSNTPVREGLLSLSSEGFVRLVPRRGFIVLPFSARDVRDLFWVQSQLAGELAARAAARATPTDIAVLERISAMHERAVEDEDRDAIARLGHDFHRVINRLSGSHRLALLLGSVVKHLPNRFYAAIEDQVSATVSQHPGIIEALRTHDTENAKRLMTDHVAEGADHLIAMLNERQIWASAETDEPAPAGQNSG